MNPTEAAHHADPPAARRLGTIADVCTLTGPSRATIERLHAAGKLPAHRRIGRRNLWDIYSTSTKLRACLVIGAC